MLKRFGGYSVLGLVLLVFGLVAWVMLARNWSSVALVHASAGALFLIIGWLRGELGGSGFFSARAAGVTLSSVGLLGVLIVINIAAGLKQPFVYDSTEQRIFTLAPQTSEVISGLNGELKIRGAFTGGKVRRDVAELFSRLRAASPLISWSVIDPERDVALIEKLGINEVDTVHFTYQARDGERTSKLAGKIDEQTVVNTLLKLTRGKPRPVYYLSGHGEPSIVQQSERSFGFLKESIEGENIKLTELNLDQGGIPSDAAAIILAAPEQPLLPVELQMIKEYLQRGGRAVMLAEPPSSADIAALAAEVGIKVGTDVIIDKNLKAVGGGDFGIEPLVSSFGSHPITVNFRQRVILSGASSVASGDLVAPSKIWDKPQVAELAFSSPTSWAERKPEQVFSEAPQASLDPDDQHGPVPVAAAFQGITLGGIDGETRVVVIGDSGFLDNVHLLQQYNKDFFLNCLNWTAGTDGGITIRPSTLRESKVSLSESQFDRMFFAAGIIFPELILLLGLVVWNARRW